MKLTQDHYKTAYVALLVEARALAGGKFSRDIKDMHTFLQAAEALRERKQIPQHPAELQIRDAALPKARHRSGMTAVRLAFIRANPTLGDVAYLTAASDMQPAAINTARSRRITDAPQYPFERGVAKFKVYNPPGRPKASFPLPLSPFTGLPYAETQACADNDHHYHDLYVFHAQAWARNLYANYLHSMDITVCPFSGLTHSQLTAHNDPLGPPDFLHLAAVYSRKMQEEKIPHVILPIPGYAKTSKEVRDPGCKHSASSSNELRTLIAVECQRFSVDYEKLIRPGNKMVAIERTRPALTIVENQGVRNLERSYAERELLQLEQPDLTDPSDAPHPAPLQRPAPFKLD